MLIPKSPKSEQREIVREQPVREQPRPVQNAFEYQEQLETLIAMGFEETPAKTCLLATNGNVMLAVNLLASVSYFDVLGCTRSKAGNSTGRSFRIGYCKA